MQRRKIWIDRFWFIIKYAIIALASAFLIRAFLLIPVPVGGNSMEGTLRQGDMVLIEKISPIKRFDVVVFQMPDGSTYIKRVIGLPGESIRYENDQLYVNDQPVDENFLVKNRKNDHENVSYTNDFDLQSLLGVEKLGKDSYFVIGDNRRASKDSRSFGAISGDAILGSARFVYYPLTHMRFI
ncbi:signal peptidase I [Enterococcus gallinarum]|uniref:signal peptidase I n=1 Tax=Enterococcus TaxID=1350 RepID=UPI0028907553|nr:signal peptidase I [Enterococcus gallinarum]MDT2678972.1 signal peptidase I [Enterococcus gallinarum]MDT2713747.1 signal peptidase I [Enterococcus gallinarum]